MPDPIKQEEVLEEIRKTNESLKVYVDKQIAEIRKTGHSSDDTEASLVKVNTEMTELRKQYEDLLTKVNRPPNEAGDSGGDENKAEAELRSVAFTKYLRYGSGETGRAMMSPEEVRALSSASDADGGFLVPVDFENDIIVQAYDDAALRGICNVAPTGRDTVFLPALSKAVVGWGTANLAVSAQDLNAGGERISIYDLRALALVHNNTLDDTDANIGSELTTMFAMAVAEAEDDAFGTGAGANTPSGVLADSRVLANSVNSGVAALLNDATHNGVDALISLMYTVKKTYRKNGHFGFNSTTEAIIRKLKDSNGQYLWQPPVQAGAPATLLGRPIVNPESFPDIAANSYPIVFGDFKRGYKIRDRSGLTVQRLVERYAEYDQTGFIVKRRTGGQVTLAEAFASLKIAA